jgi:hypothetical protein
MYNPLSLLPYYRKYTPQSDSSCTYPSTPLFNVNSVIAYPTSNHHPTCDYFLAPTPCLTFFFSYTHTN